MKNAHDFAGTDRALVCYKTVRGSRRADCVTDRVGGGARFGLGKWKNVFLISTFLRDRC